MEQILDVKQIDVIFTCRNCKNEIISDALFCKNCGAQVKCKICKSLLEEDSSFCINCGAQISLNLHSEKGAINNFDYTQKGNTKIIRAKFTNAVGGYFAGLFNNVISGNPLPQRNPFKLSPQLTSSKNQVNGNIQKEITNNIQDAEIIETDSTEIIAKIFKQGEEGKLELIDNRLKEKSKRDKAKRLTILFFYAKKLQSIDCVSREELNQIITREKLNGGNFRKFLSKEALKYISQKDNGDYTLLKGGEDEAEKILSEIANPNYHPTVSKVGRKTGKKSSNTSVKSEGQNVRNSNSNNLSAFEALEKLISENYFSNRRKLNDIVAFCEEKKAIKFSPQNLSSALSRLIKDEVLEREKNNDNQYEYWKK